MLYEIHNVKQNKGEPERRWFYDDEGRLDLLIWVNPKGAIVGFQLCYDKTSDEHALTWFEEKGFVHNRVDDGESPSGEFKSIPILLLNGAFPHKRITDSFKRVSRHMDPEITSFILEKISEFS